MAKRVNKRGTNRERKRIVNHVIVIGAAVQHGTGIAKGDRHRLGPNRSLKPYHSTLWPESQGL